MFNRNQGQKTPQAEGGDGALNKQNFFAKENPGVVNLKANQGDFEIGDTDFQMPSGNSKIEESEMAARPANNSPNVNGGIRTRQSQDAVNSELFDFSDEAGNNAGGNMPNGARNVPNNNMNTRPVENESPYKVNNQAIANEEPYNGNGGMNDNDSEELLLNEETVKEKESMNWAIFVLFLVIIVLMGGVIYLFVENQKLKNSSGAQVVGEVSESQSETDSSAVSAATEEKEKTETVASADKSETGVKILNASGVAGAAGKIKDFLGSDYKKVDTGNYSKTITGTTIYYSEEKFKAMAEEMAESLKEKKLNPEVELASSSEDKSADVVVVLGK